MNDAIGKPSNLSIYAIYAIALLAEGAGTVVIPLWVLSLNPTPAMFGIVIGAKGLLPLLFSIHGGVLMDRFGADRILRAASLVGVFLPIFFPLLPNLWSAIFLQMISGLIITISWIGVQTLISQSLKGERHYFSRLSFANRTGVFICPLVAGFSWDVWGSDAGFVTMFVMSVIALASSFLLPKPETKLVLRSFTSAEFIPRLADYRDALLLLSIPAVLLTSLASVINVAVGTVQQSFYIVYLEKLGMTGTMIAILVAAPNLLGVMGAMGIGNAVRKIGDVKMLVYVVMLSSLVVCLTPIFVQFPALLLLGSLRGWGMGAAQPLMMSIPAGVVPNGAHGSVAGLRISINRLVQTLLPPAMGLIVELAGLENSFFITGTLMLLLTIMILRMANREEKIRH